jgi:hypothetical protein
VKEVAHVAGQRLWGTTGGDLVSALIALTLISPVSAYVMIGPRVLEAMSSDGFMPRSFSRLNRRNVPATAVFVQAALAAVIAVTSSFGPLLIYIGFTLTIFAALTVLSLFRLRRRAGIKRVCIGYPVTPLIFLAFALWATVWSIRSQPVPTLAALATLLVVYAAHVVTTKIPHSTDIGIYTDKLGDSAREIVRQAYEEARLLNDDQLRAQHALIAISKLLQPQFETLLSGLSLDRQTILQAIPVQSSQRTSPADAVLISQEFNATLLEALKHARDSGRRRIEAIDILFGLLADPRGSTARLFEQLGADREAVLQRLETLSSVD